MSDTGVGELRAFVGELADLVRLAAEALDGATAALTAEVGAADGVVRSEKALAELRGRIEEDAGAAPAGVRAVVAGVQVGREVEWLGVLAERLLEVAWARQQDREPFPEQLLTSLRAIADAAVGLVGRAADVLEQAAPEAVADLLSDMPETARRQRLLYERLLAAEAPVDLGTAADLVLLSGHYQQCAEHAGAIGRYALLFTGPSSPGRGRS
ncbi:hypothetical protein [Kitasatospora griseola]|uniref:hypothetical protein n=1 Tax=Kitasatospora griseola TaxID=2064 RepID=UPI001670227C|nr:hypothetical protein [Kitasatospora griseola]GGQ88552.1 hypothetical protein GCM10010195_50390 [Kitasatospora griseola]